MQFNDNFIFSHILKHLNLKHCIDFVFRSRSNNLIEFIIQQKIEISTSLSYLCFLGKLFSDKKICAHIPQIASLRASHYFQKQTRNGSYCL